VTSDAVVPLRVALRAWFSISLRTFGGPAGQIAVMHKELVEERRWIGEQRFLHALSYCTLLPGPEAQQLAIYLGWLLNGTVGGLIAGILFVVPGYVALMVLSAIYAKWGATTAITAIFAGLAPAVLAIVSQAVWRIGKRSLHHRVLQIIALGAFLGLFVFKIPFPIALAGAGLVGYLVSQKWPSVFASKVATQQADVRAPLIGDDSLHGELPSLRRAVQILAVGLTLWALPIVAVASLFGRSHVFVKQGLFFSVALAETTPGPLIMVVQFVGFLGAFRNPGSLNPWAAAVLGSTLVVWVTFVPCFLFVFLGAPHIEGMRNNKKLSGALTAITAAVVGVIANLSVYFSLHTLFNEATVIRAGAINLEVPIWSTLNVRAMAISLLAFVLIFRFKLSVLRVLGICAVLGALVFVIFE
jgi:chromate transporter